MERQMTGQELIEKHKEGERDFRWANLCGANLCGANLCGANLRGANLRGADLRWANLCGANLCGADLRGANLRNANLCEANLCGANLRGANLRGADLRWANLCGAKYSITSVLLAYWGDVSPDLCRDLMRLDAEALPNGAELMQQWADGGPCPLDMSGGYWRAANFRELREHWEPGPAPTLWELWQRLAEEKGVKISGVSEDEGE
jgi:hypothetical protein